MYISYDDKIKKFRENIMKKLLICLTILALLIASLVSCSPSDSQSDDGQTPNDTPAEGKLGDYTVVIDSIRSAKDYEGEPIVIIKYLFTNNDDDDHSFLFAIDANAYQNGVELSHCYFVDKSANYSSDNQDKDIKKGVTLEVEVAYELNDTKSNIDVDVKELFSFYDTKLTKTFEISSLFSGNEANSENNTENSTEAGTEASTSDKGDDNTSSENTLGKYEVVIDSCRLANDYSGDPVVIIKYLFTNNSNEPASFIYSLSTNVFQNGVGLSDCYFVDESANYSSSGKSKNIQPGVTLEVEVAYILNDTTTPLDVEVTKLFSYNDSTKVTATLEIPA